MCLRSKQICPLRARRDIVCYKAFYEHHSRFIRTLYMEQLIEKPTEGHPTLMDDTDTPLGILRQDCWYPYVGRMKCQIFGGMIHAFRSKPIERIIELYKAKTYKCIIPKGTLYYVGMEDDICAKQMLVVEEVNPNTAG